MRAGAALGYYFQILGGLYALEFLTPLLFLLLRANGPVAIQGLPPTRSHREGAEKCIVD